MARTYRRKNVEFWDTEEEYTAWINSITCTTSFYRSYWKPTYIEEINWFHSDNYDPSTPDKAFRRLYGHKFDRAATRIAISKEIRSIEYGNVIFNKARDIAWEWD